MRLENCMWQSTSSDADEGRPKVRGRGEEERRHKGETAADAEKTEGGARDVCRITNAMAQNFRYNSIHAAQYFFSCTYCPSYQNFFCFFRCCCEGWLCAGRFGHLEWQHNKNSSALPHFLKIVLHGFRFLLHFHLPVPVRTKKMLFCQYHLAAWRQRKIREVTEFEAVFPLSLVLCFDSTEDDVGHT